MNHVLKIKWEKIKHAKCYLILSYTKSFILYYYFFLRNKHVSFFNFNQLAKNYPIFALSKNPGIIGNKCYGNWWAVKCAKKSRFEKDCIIEHGIYFGKHILEGDLVFHKPKVIYTFGEYRKNALEIPGSPLLVGVRIEPVGPYIIHVKNFLNPRSRRKIKKNYGKILLVFPTHGSPEVDLSYDQKAFMESIDRISKRYDTVFVSVYWLDIINSKYLIYQQKGYKIVTSGTRNDPRFLNRLKDLIELSDMTMSNDLGTHIGYCIALNKPHYLFAQEITSVDVQPEYALKPQEGYHDIIAYEKKLFVRVFSSEEPIISEEQRELVKYYWG